MASKLLLVLIVANLHGVFSYIIYNERYHRKPSYIESDYEYDQISNQNSDNSENNNQVADQNEHSGPNELYGPNGNSNGPFSRQNGPNNPGFNPFNYGPFNPNAVFNPYGVLPNGGGGFPPFNGNGYGPNGGSGYGPYTGNGFGPFNFNGYGPNGVNGFGPYDGNEFGPYGNQDQFSFNWNSFDNSYGSRGGKSKGDGADQISNQNSDNSKGNTQIADQSMENDDVPFDDYDLEKPKKKHSKHNPHHHHHRGRKANARNIIFNPPYGERSGSFQRAQQSASGLYSNQQ